MQTVLGSDVFTQQHTLHCLLDMYGLWWCTKLAFQARTYLIQPSAHACGPGLCSNWVVKASTSNTHPSTHAHRCQARRKWCFPVWTCIKQLSLHGTSGVYKLVFPSMDILHKDFCACIHIMSKHSLVFGSVEILDRVLFGCSYSPETELSKNDIRYTTFYTCAWTLFVNQLGCPSKYILYTALYAWRWMSVVSKIVFPRVDIHSCICMCMDFESLVV